jgi:hypothetical protein
MTDMSLMLLLSDGMTRRGGKHGVGDTILRMMRTCLELRYGDINRHHLAAYLTNTTP